MLMLCLCVEIRSCFFFSYIFILIFLMYIVRIWKENVFFNIFMIYILYMHVDDGHYLSLPLCY